MQDGCRYFAEADITADEDPSIAAIGRRDEDATEIGPRAADDGMRSGFRNVNAAVPPFDGEVLIADVLLPFEGSGDAGGGILGPAADQVQIAQDQVGRITHFRAVLAV